MNENRHIFSIHGITGMLIATVLLLSILAGLTWWGISAQQSVMKKPYKLKNPTELQMNSSSNKEHIEYIKGK